MFLIAMWAAMLRMHLIELARARLASVSKKEKTEYLYDYLSGPQFRQRSNPIIALDEDA